MKCIMCVCVCVRITNTSLKLYDCNTGTKISKTGVAMLTKIVLRAFDINPYLHEFFEPILIDSIFSLPWTIVHVPKGKFGQI